MAPSASSPGAVRTASPPIALLLLAVVLLAPPAPASSAAWMPPGRAPLLSLPPPASLPEASASASAPASAAIARSTTQLQYLPSYTEPDPLQFQAGGKRYEMVPLPDSMCGTTVWIGNLCEFVTGGDLSALLSGSACPTTVPACVARNPNASSRGYGFATFPTEQMRDSAILRFHGTELQGRRIRVEPITDKPGQNRVRVPGKIVAYVLGFVPAREEGGGGTGLSGGGRGAGGRKKGRTSPLGRVTAGGTDPATPPPRGPKGKRGSHRQRRRRRGGGGGGGEAQRGEEGTRWKGRVKSLTRRRQKGQGRMADWFS